MLLGIIKKRLTASHQLDSAEIAATLQAINLNHFNKLGLIIAKNASPQLVAIKIVFNNRTVTHDVSVPINAPAKQSDG